jgi:hypothetical protein
MIKDNRNNGSKRWFITLSLFFSSVVVFIIIDGTILEPRLNRMGKFMENVVGEKLEWFTLYHSLYLKSITIIFTLYIIIKALEDIIVFLKKRK